MQATPVVRANLLIHFRKLGYTLRETMHPQRLGNHPAQLVRVCRQNGVNFPDLDEVEREVKAARKRS